MTRWNALRALINYWQILRMNKMEVKYEISQVMNLTEAMMLDCYYIVSQSWPNEADGVFYSLQTKANKPGQLMFIASDKTGVMRGFIYGHVLGNSADAKIDWLFVEPRHRHGGVGGMLMQACENYCRARSVTRLDVQPARTVQAKQFYAKQGFKPSDFIIWSKDLGR